MGTEQGPEVTPVGPGDRVLFMQSHDGHTGAVVITNGIPACQPVPLGVCGGGVTGEAGCGETVFSGEKFDIYRYAWGSDFSGDRAGARIVFTHAVCNAAAIRPKDGE
jgi:hypothetical protein